MADNSSPAIPSIILRAPEPSDLDCLYIWENTPEIRRHGCMHAPLSRHQLWEYIQTYDANPLRSGQLRLMVIAGDRPVGAVDLYDVDPCNRNALVGIMIAPEFQRRGYGQMALDLLSDYCRADLGLNQLAAVVSGENIASVALFQSAGFTECGCFRNWLRKSDNSFADAIIFQLQL